MTNSNSEYSENSDNSDLENSAWYQDCNGFTNTFESFKTYMFSQELSSDTHIGFGRVRLTGQPLTRARILFVVGRCALTTALAARNCCS